MTWLTHDLPQAWRSLRRRPAFSALAILALAAGLGLNTVAFSAVNALLYKPFRFQGATEAGWLFVGTRRAPLATTHRRAFEALRDHRGSLARISAEGRVPFAWRHEGGTEEIWSLIVSADYFSIVHVTPLIGRTLTAAGAPQATPVALVSERFWRDRLGAPRDLGTVQLVLNRAAVPVVGVLPDGFQGPSGVYEPDVWLPLEATAALNLPAAFTAPDAAWLSFLAAPVAGITKAAVEADIASAVSGAIDVPAGDTLSVRYERFIDRHPEARGLAPVAAVGMVAVGSVLLIACFNVAGLMLARSLERRREISVRAALGASRWRIARALLTEGLLFGAIGGAAALLLATWSADLLAAFSLPAPVPQRLHFVIDWRLLLYAAAVSLVASVIPALAPLWHVTRSDLAHWSRPGATAGADGTGQRRARRAFVLLQVAGSTLFVAISLLTLSAFRDAWRLDSGFDPDRTAVLLVDPIRYGAAPAEALRTTRDIAERVARVPGVTAAAVADRAPYQVGAQQRSQIAAERSDCTTAACQNVNVTRVDRTYFATTSRPLLAGRGGPEGPVTPDEAIISESLAARLWPGAVPLGQSVWDATSETWRTVVGVARDTQTSFLGQTATSEMYLPIEPTSVSAGLAVIVRTNGSARELLGPIRDVVASVDDALPVQSLQTMTDRMALPLWLPRTTLGFFSLCAGLAVILSSVGLFGVTYYAVQQRRREFGVRSALGATPADVKRQVLSETFRLSAPGTALGLAAAVGVAILARSALPAFPAFSLLPVVVAALLQSAVALAAGWAPAHRAAGANPVDVLRAD